MQGQPVRGGDCLADGLDHGAGLRVAVDVQLVHDHDALRPVHLDGEGGRAADAHPLVARLDGVLDVGGDRCVVRVSGVVECWGSNVEGSLGVGSPSSATATRVTLPGRATEVSSGGGGVSCAVLEDGKLITNRERPAIRCGRDAG